MAYYIATDKFGNYDLAHHGILGQKWGIRRYQNKDGSLTPAGKKRYASGKLQKNKNFDEKAYSFYLKEKSKKEYQKYISDLISKHTSDPYPSSFNPEYVKNRKEIDKRTREYIELVFNSYDSDPKLNALLKDTTDKADLESAEYDKFTHNKKLYEQYVNEYIKSKGISEKYAKEYLDPNHVPTALWNYYVSKNPRIDKIVYSKFDNNIALEKEAKRYAKELLGEYASIKNSRGYALSDALAASIVNRFFDKVFDEQDLREIQREEAKHYDMSNYYIATDKFGNYDLCHYGTKGMKWGVVNEDPTTGLNAGIALTKAQKDGIKRTQALKAQQQGSAVSKQNAVKNNSNASKNAKVSPKVQQQYTEAIKEQTEAAAKEEDANDDDAKKLADANAKYQTALMNMQMLARIAQSNGVSLGQDPEYLAARKEAIKAKYELDMLQVEQQQKAAAEPAPTYAEQKQSIDSEAKKQLAEDKKKESSSDSLDDVYQRQADALARVGKKASKYTSNKSH